jgi:hypothetical protein
MPFPAKPKRTDGPTEPKKGPQILEDGRLRGCTIARGPEVVEVDGTRVELTVQVSQPATTGTRINNEKALVRLARAALGRPGGVKHFMSGLIKVTARQVN